MKADERKGLGMNEDLFYTDPNPHPRDMPEWMIHDDIVNEIQRKAYGEVRGALKKIAGYMKIESKLVIVPVIAFLLFPSLSYAALFPRITQGPPDVQIRIVESNIPDRHVCALEGIEVKLFKVNRPKHLRNMKQGMLADVWVDERGIYDWRRAGPVDITLLPSVDKSDCSLVSSDELSLFNQGEQEIFGSGNRLIGIVRRIVEEVCRILPDSQEVIVRPVMDRESICDLVCVISEEICASSDGCDHHGMSLRTLVRKCGGCTS